MASLEQVVAHIHGLHRDVANVQTHSRWLQDFQQIPEAWGMIKELLTGSQDELVQYFAAQTLVAKLQAGQPPQENGASCGQVFMQYFMHYHRGPHAVRRQLAAAIVDNALWRPPSEDSQWFSTTVQQLSNGSNLLPCLLELLVIIPEETANRKVVIEAQRRSSFAGNMLQHTNSTLDALWKVCQAESSCTSLALTACSRWLHLQHASPSLRAQKRAGGGVNGGSGPFTADIIKHGSIHTHPLLLQAAQAISNVGTAPLEVVRSAADVLSEAHALTNETIPQAQPLLTLVMQAVVAGGRQLLPGTQENLSVWLAPESDITARAAVLGRLVGELGGVFTRLTVAVGQARDSLGAASVPQQMEEMNAILNDLCEVALHYVRLRQVDLAKCGLDFWYLLLSQHLGALTEEDDPFDEDAGAPALKAGISEAWKDDKFSRAPDADNDRKAQEKRFLAAPVQKMVEAHWRSVRYPPEPEKENHFEWDEFVRFRELCAINVTEACLVVTPRWIIEHIGQILEKICAAPPIAWQDIDACVFVLTAVASRAPAGQDSVIPRLIELLPQLPYPTEGFKALLLRCAASRLVLFTSGYLALNPEPCKQILLFLTMQHLPAIPGLPAGPDPDAKKYGEALACDAMKMVMTAARKIIVAADNGTIWRDVVSAVINLVADSRYNVDCRAQLVFGIGQVLSVLEWDALENMLDQFVTRMQAPLEPIFTRLPPEPVGSAAVKQTRDGKAPLELKLYVAAVSSVYNMPPRAADAPMPDHHPVLAVVEKHFLVIERLCLHHTQYDDLMEQVCLAFSYILGFAREYAPNSKVFVPMMKLMARCCEYHPQPFYLGLVRSVIGFFLSASVEQPPALIAILVDLTGLFIQPIASTLSGTACGTAQPLAPSINTAGYEMLSEAMRHWNMALMACQTAPWLPNVLDATLEVLPFIADSNLVVHERTICAMLGFVRNMLLWSDPESRKGDNAPELIELQNQVQGMLSERQLPHGPALPRLVVVLARLLAAAAQHSPSRSQAVPSIADVLQKFFNGPFDHVVSSQLPVALRSLPEPLGSSISDADLQRLIQQLKMDRGDGRRFARSIVSLAENFAVCLKKASFRRLSM